MTQQSIDFEKIWDEIVKALKRGRNVELKMVKDGEIQIVEIERRLSRKIPRE